MHSTISTFCRFCCFDDPDKEGRQNSGLCLWPFSGKFLHLLWNICLMPFLYGICECIMLVKKWSLQIFIPQYKQKLALIYTVSLNAVFCIFDSLKSVLSRDSLSDTLAPPHTHTYTLALQNTNTSRYEVISFKFWLWALMVSGTTQ